MYPKNFNWKEISNCLSTWWSAFIKKAAHAWWQLHTFCCMCKHEYKVIMQAHSTVFHVYAHVWSDLFVTDL